MFPNKQQMQPKPKKQDDDCIIETKRTKSGKRTIIKGKCTREKIEAAKDFERD